MRGNDAFLAARGVSAADVAKQAGLRLRRYGGREWACCPFHAEKTPSCMFDSRYHYFGCGADGDGIDLYSRLYGVDKLAAARALARGNYQHNPRPTVHRRKEAQDDEGYSWDTLCRIRHMAQERMEAAKPDSDEFWMMLAVRAEADMKLENLNQGEETE